MKVVAALSSILIFLSLKAQEVRSDSGNDQAESLTNLINEAYADAFNYEYPNDSKNDFPYDPEKIDQFSEEFNFIIVGAGSAGAVLARRLSEEKSWKILLLEAGKPGNAATNIPSLYSAVQLSSYNWGYHTVPQKTCCLSYENSRCTYPRGKSLGGSSSINALVFTRGNPNDYNAWAKEGNEGWAWKDVEPYFRVIENATEISNIDQEYRGFKGPMNLESNRGNLPTSDYIIRANNEIGRNIVDYNGKTEFGVSIPQLTTKMGVRHSTENAYLQPIQGTKQNLKIITRALVTKILINEREKSAYGVRFIHDGTLYEVHASTEVILSAGVFNSPQLLMLSGIGTRKELKEHQIKPILHLPVGRNFHDHPRTVGIFFTHNATCEEPLALSVSKYLANGTGPLSASGLEIISFIGTKLNKNRKNPDIEHLFTVQNVTDGYYAFSQKLVGWTDETTKTVISPLMNKCTWQTSTLLLHPKSRGSVSLKSKNPLDFPLIDMNYFTDEEDIDLETHVEAILDTFRLAETPAFRSINSKYESLPLKGCESHVFLSRDYWRCYVRHMSYTTYHGAGTCKMGLESDPTSVVDHKLRVHGMKNLRVIDASVMPSPIAGHLNGPTIMIAEKSADNIKKYYNKYEF